MDAFNHPGTTKVSWALTSMPMWYRFFYLQFQQNEARHWCHWSVVPPTLTLQYLPLSHKIDIPYIRKNSLEKQIDGWTLG